MTSRINDLEKGLKSSKTPINRHQGALTAFEQAIHLDPNYATAYNNKGLAPEVLGKKQEAQQAYEKSRQLGDST